MTGFLAKLAAFLLSILGAGAWAWRAKGKLEDGKSAEEYRDTRKRMDDAETGDGSASDDRDWLRDRAER